MFTKVKSNAKLKVTALIVMMLIMIMSVSYAAIDIMSCTIELYEGSTLVDDNFYKYDSLPKTPRVVLKQGSNTINSNYYTVTYSNNVGASMGTSLCQIVGDGTNLSGTVNKYFNINPVKLVKGQNFQFEVGGTKVYDGEVSHPKITTAKIKASDNKWYDLGWTSFKFDGTDGQPEGFYYPIPQVDMLQVGNYFIYFAGDNFEDTLIDWVYVFPKPITCTWTPNTFVYDGQNHVPTPTFSTGITGETVATYSDVTGSQKNVGTGYPASTTVTKISDSSNKYAGYGLSNDELDTLLLNNYLMFPDTYDGSNYNSLVSSYNPTITGEDAFMAGGAAPSFSPTMAQWLADGIGDYRKISNTTFEITPKEIVVTANNKNVRTGDAFPTLDYTSPTGAVTGETAKLTGTLKAVRPTDGAKITNTNTAGTYDIVKDTLALTDNGAFKASNYSLTVNPGTLTITGPKTITANDVSNPEDKVYKGSAWVQDPTVTVDGTVLTKDTHYTVSYSPNIDVGTVTITITGIESSGYEGTVTKTFRITPVPLTVDWSDIYQFYYDGQKHIRKGTVTSPINGETVVYTLATQKVDVGDYTATITITGISGGQRKLSNYTLPSANELSRPFEILALPISTPEPTYEPDPDPQSDPEVDPVPGYQVHIEITWPDYEETYTGTEKEPKPTKVEMIITDSTGTPVGTPITLVEGTDYEVVYNNNIDAAEKTDGSAPQAVVSGLGPNITGDSEPFKFTIKPAEIKVKADDKSKVEGQENPSLTYTVTKGAVHGETEAFTGALACAATIQTPAGSTEPITQNTLALTDGDMGTQGTTFKASNYTLSFTEGTLTINPKELIEITDPDVSDPEDKPYKGTEWIQDPVVTVDGVELVKDRDYTVTYSDNIDAGTATITITGIGDYTGTVTKTFKITPAELIVTWSDIYQFQYDGQKHIRKGKVESEIPDEIVEFTLQTQQVNAGNYTATITITGISGGRADLNNYVMPENSELKRPFEIAALPVPTPEPTYEPDPDPESNPDVEPVPGYTVEIVIVWPEYETDYDGTNKEPKPTSVQMIIKDSSGNPVGTPVDLVEGTDYEIEYTNNKDAANKDDANAPQAVIKGLGPNITGESDPFKFTINPIPLEVTWNDRDTFQFDGQYHIRKGWVEGPLDTEAIEYTLTGKQKNVGEGYEAVINITGVEGGKLTNYILPDPADLVRTFKIVSLPIDEEKPTVEPEPDPEQDPTNIPEDGYTVEIVVEWPDVEYPYDGTPKTPTPTKVELVIKDQDGNPVGNPETLSPDDYELIYEDNIDAAQKDDPTAPPTVTIKAKEGGNITGQIESPFTITPAEMQVKAEDKSKKKGKDNPELTYKVTGAKNGEVPAFDGALETTCEKNSPVGSYPIYCDGKLVAKDNDAFKVSNYNITYVDGKIKVTTSGSGGPSTPNPKVVDLAVDLRSGSPNKDKVNLNHYKIVEEEVIYWVDYINGGDSTGSAVNLVLNLPLDFQILDADGGTVDASKNKITWKFASGLKKGEGGTKEVHLKYTKFSKPGITDEDIYPMATIALLTAIKDKSSVHNIVYTDGVPVKIEHKVYMWGDEDTPTFRPTDYITRAEGAMVLLRIFDISYQDVTVKGNEFPDIGDTYEQAQKAIVKAAKLGLVDGYEDGTYKPNRKMNRAEFMKLIAVYVEHKAKEDGIEGIDLDDTKTVTKYAAQNNWANKYVTLLVRLNLTPLREDNHDLQIEGEITRAQVAQLCNLYLFRCPVYDDGRIELPFEDVNKKTELWGDIVEATRPTHDVYDLNENTYEVWDYDDWKAAYEKGFTNKYLY